MAFKENSESLATYGFDLNMVLRAMIKVYFQIQGRTETVADM